MTRETDHFDRLLIIDASPPRRTCDRCRRVCDRSVSTYLVSLRMYAPSRLTLGLLTLETNRARFGVTPLDQRQQSTCTTGFQMQQSSRMMRTRALTTPHVTLSWRLRGDEPRWQHATPHERFLLSALFDSSKGGRELRHKRPQEARRRCGANTRLGSSIHRQAA